MSLARPRLPTRRALCSRVPGKVSSCALRRAASSWLRCSKRGPSKRRVSWWHGAPCDDDTAVCNLAAFRRSSRRRSARFRVRGADVVVPRSTGSRPRVPTADMIFTFASRRTSREMVAQLEHLEFLPEIQQVHGFGFEAGMQAQSSSSYHLSRTTSVPCCGRPRRHS